MKHKKLFAILTLVCFLFTLMPMAAMAEDSTMNFADVQPSDWYYTAVQYVAKEGIMSGTGENEFNPNATLTRATLMTVLHRMEGSPAVTGANPFKDVADGQWYTEAIIWAAANKIAGGYTADTFGPNDSLTREQLAAFMQRYTMWKNIDVSVGENTNILSYNDAFSISAWAYGALQWACGVGIIGSVDDGNLAPQGTATRAQLAAIMQRFDDNVLNGAEDKKEEEKKPVYSGGGGYSHSHSYGAWVSNEDGTHTKTCSCGNTVTADCTMGSVVAGDGTHSQTCTVCGYVVTESCEYTSYTAWSPSEGNVTTGSAIELNTHFRTDTCTCTNTVTETTGCVYEFVFDEENDNHVKQCETCGYQIDERTDCIFENGECTVGTHAHQHSYNAGYVKNVDGTHNAKCRCGALDEVEECVYEFDSENKREVCVCGNIGERIFVSTADELSEALTADEENISVVLLNDIDLPITSLGTITPGSGEYKLGGESTESIIIDLNQNKLNITTGYWSAIGAKNADAIITIKNGSMTSSQATGTWNSYDLTFANCDYVIEDLTFDKAIAFTNAGHKATLTKVVINETHDYYAMWITAEGQEITIDGLTINSDGRGIKIDEQYVDAPAKVTLNVSNAYFIATKKAAILVKSTAGADIALENVDITNVVADKNNAVWIDEDAAAYADLVTVTGGSKMIEGAVTTADALVAAFANLKAGDVIYIGADIDMTGKTITPVTGNKGFTMYGDGHTISNLNSTAAALFVDHSGSSAYVFDGIKLENCSVNSATNYGALFVGDGDTSEAITITDCHVNNCTVVSAKYAAAFVGYTAGYNVQNDGPVYSDVTITDCSVTGGSITGGGSTGAAIGHAGGNADTTNEITNLAVTEVAINGEDADHTGVVVGTANVGETIIDNATYSDVTGNYNSAHPLYGRFVPNSTGTLEIDGAVVVADTTALSDALADGGDVVLEAGNYTLPSVSNNDVTISGTKDTVITVNKPNYSGSDVTLEGVTVQGSGYATGIQHVNTVTYDGATIVGEMCLYGEKVVFNNCTFELAASQYIWTYGAKEVEFNECIFNTAGKAILIYNEGAGASKVTVNGCTFNASAGAKAGAIANQNCAAIEIDNFQSSGTGAAHSLITTGNNTYVEDFSGLWRIKNYVSGNAITVNDVAYTTIAIDGKTMTIDGSKNVTVNE